ncbi:Uncharacterised protein [Legionella busanensis]|uniref:Transmembrane protein n=1 Tax=Legionella busanensis TaxID=190655 RepID=A0A378JX44_9GAMM|nr:hypothetical protein [Legionella busanensis]STX52792.1 Uncharacterised protein [Legionella busanensis]
MPGFFSAKAAQSLTEWSNFYIDWSRVGELLRQGTHRYTRQELIQRGIILISIGAGGYTGYNYNNQNSSLMSGLYSMSGCFVGFVVSHLVVIAPLIYKRYQLSQECADKQKIILDSLQELKSHSPNQEIANNLIGLIATHVQTIMTMNLSTESRANASLTWGRRRSLLTNLATKLNDDIDILNNNSDFIEEMQQFWSKDTNALVEELKTYSLRENANIENFTATPTLR